MLLFRFVLLHFLFDVFCFPRFVLLLLVYIFVFLFSPDDGTAIAVSHNNNTNNSNNQHITPSHCIVIYIYIYIYICFIVLFIYLSISIQYFGTFRRLRGLWRPRMQTRSKPLNQRKHNKTKLGASNSVKLEEPRVNLKNNFQERFLNGWSTPPDSKPLAQVPLMHGPTLVYIYIYIYIYI